MERDLPDLKVVWYDCNKFSYNIGTHANHDDENGNYSLKIQPETIYRGELSVAGNFDLFRIEINGILNIQEYCKTNNIKSWS
jgi:hypothetical protein